MSVFPGYKPKFEVNNDFAKLVFSFHNVVGHFFGSMLMAFLFSLLHKSPILGFRDSYGFWFAWEVGDGWKPWWNDKRYKHYNTDPGLKAWFIANFLLSDKFSMQDAFVWDLFGALIGTVLGSATLYLFN